jgi:hypothetical protein
MCRLHIQLCRLAACFFLDSCFTYFSTLNIEAVGYSEMSTAFYRTTRHYIPEDNPFQGKVVCVIKQLNTS